MRITSPIRNTPPVLHLGPAVEQSHSPASLRQGTGNGVASVPGARSSGGSRGFFGRLLLLLTFGVWLTWPRESVAALPALRIELEQAMQSLDHSFDPRSDSQWGARNKPMPGGEQPWMARYAFNAERIRSILTAVYYKGPLRLGHSAAALVVVEAGRTRGVAEIDIIVSKTVFLELQTTLKAPPGVRLLFPEPQGFKDEYRMNVRYENR
jgi:hypothetical protein